MHKKFKLYIKGLVPMPKEDFIDMLEFMNKLHKTPVDNWDLKRRSFAISHEDGSVENYSFNPLVIDYQVGQFLLKKYGDDIDQFHACMCRFWAVGRFFAENMSKLKKEGLMKETDVGYKLISEVLIEALSALPFSEKRIIEGSEDYAFSYEEVVEKTTDFLFRQ